MAINQVNIYGKGHVLCLYRALQASLEEESFADVRLSVYNSSGVSEPTLSLNGNGSHQYLRANKAVLAAASPVFANILKERTEDDETTLVFDGYTQEDITNLLQYIYTGQITTTNTNEKSFRSLVEYLCIGNSTKSREESENNKLSNRIAIDTNIISLSSKKTIMCQKKPEFSSASITPKNLNKVTKEKHGNIGKILRKLPQHPTRPLQLPLSEITIKDPVLDCLNGLKNPDAMRPDALLEKSAFKYKLLLDANPDVTGITIMDYSRMADRLGIYFDPQLFNYYRSLVRALPPIRIFLHIEDGWSDSESENIESLHLIKSKVAYPGAHKSPKCCKKRKSFSSMRLPVKTLCCVNGKTHVTLDGQPIAMDTSIKPIEYPLLEEDEQNQADRKSDDDEFEMSPEIEAEARRKRVLLSTLNRLKKDHSQAKKVAQSILKASASKTFDIDGNASQVIESPKKISQRMVICEICGKLISASWIRIHFANHQGEKNYLCEHCGRSFASANLLKSHVHYQHNNQLDLIKCSICSKQFTKKSRLEIHMRIHNNTRPYRCPIPECGKTFHTNGNLRKHSFVHSGEKPHKCDICGKSFSQATNLRLHMRIHQQLLDEGSKSVTQRIRKPEAVFCCEYCPMTFSRIRHFNAHRATHTGEQTVLPCSICQQQFSDINGLKQHKKENHPGTVHQCQFCDKTFFKKTAMQRHQACHTEEPTPKPNFPCQHCNSQFTTAAARTVHERTHTGERPFKCPTCSKSFTSKYNFRQHLRMHSEDRPFKCLQCNKAFRQPQHLRAHAYTHKSQDEPVPCPICGKMFRNKILVMSHKRIHKQAKINQATTNQGSLQQPQEPGLHFVDNNMGFVNILVLAENTELQ